MKTDETIQKEGEKTMFNQKQHNLEKERILSQLEDEIREAKDKRDNSQSDFEFTYWNRLYKTYFDFFVTLLDSRYNLRKILSVMRENSQEYSRFFINDEDEY